MAKYFRPATKNALVSRAENAAGLMEFWAKWLEDEAKKGGADIWEGTPGDPRPVTLPCSVLQAVVEQMRSCAVDIRKFSSKGGI
jgi:hypothetical protein